MKKQFNYLMMVVAIMLLAATGAMAQGLTAADPVWHLANSSEDLSVNDNGAGFTYTWAVTQSACDGTSAGAAAGASFSVDNAPTGTIDYDATASGTYRITCQESNGNCTTTRVFYTAIVDVDVAVIASDDLGAAVGALASCNDYELRSGLTPADLADNATVDLTTYSDAAYFSERYVNVQLTTDDASGCGLTAPASGTFAWEFDYDMTSGATAASSANFIDATNYVGIVGAPAAVTDTPGASNGVGSIAVTAGTVDITLPIQVLCRWSTTVNGADQSFTFDVSNVVLDGNGGESGGNDANNNASEQIIYGRPATSIITN